MKLDISPQEFNSLSGEKKKKYIVRLLVQSSGAVSVEEPDPPVAFVMAGLPGAGKTEFLDSLAENAAHRGVGNFLRIDLDEIVSAYPGYTPKDYYKFRNNGNNVLARAIDTGRKGRYNMLIDGTFSGMSGASVDGVGKLLESGYIVRLVYMYDDADRAWGYTLKREVETGRSIDREGFLAAEENLKVNLRKAIERYRDNPFFDVIAVIQKELRDKEYDIRIGVDEIDKVV